MAVTQRTLEIGGVPVRLRSSRQEFWSCAERSYGGFFAPDGTVPEETIEVEVPSESDLPLPEGAPPPTARSEDNGVVRLVHGWGVAKWDREKRYARVRHAESDYRAPCPEYVCDTVLRMMLAERLLEREGCLVHAASVVRNGRGYLFAGPSGAGKSTLARLSAATSTILSDDLSLVRLTPAGARVFATPFLGEYEKATQNTSAPLAAICLLRQAPQNAVKLPARQLAVREVLRCVLFARRHAAAAAATLDLVVRLVDRVPSFELYFRPHASFWSCLDAATDSDSK